MKHEDKLPASIGLGITLGILAAIPIFVCIGWLLWQIPIPVRLHEFTEHLKYWTAMQINELAPPLFQSSADTYRHFLKGVQIGPRPFIWRFDIASFIAILVGSYIGYLVGKPESAIQHVAGRQLWFGKVGVKRLTNLFNQECKVSSQGISMHPSFEWSLSRNRETLHTMIIGSSGSGKTQILKPLIQAVIDRDDRILLFDVKGDFTRWLPKLLLLAPWDSRSAVWDIAKDCSNDQDARQLASRLIPSGHDPVWHLAARQLLTALLMKLQDEQGVSWGWRDLYILVCSDAQILLSAVKKYLPEATHVVNAPGKTTQSVLINFGSNMSLIGDLARAWGDAPLERRFSILEWLKNKNTRYRIVVLQGSGHYEELAQAYLQSVMAMGIGFINSADFGDSDERRIWFVLDEFPEMGKIEHAASLLAVARSKGVRVVLTMQDINMLKAIYGEHVASSWMSLVGTHVYARINPGETANFIAEVVIGHRTIDRIITHNGERLAPVREKPLVVEPVDLHKLGADKRGIDALMLAHGDAYLLHWPITEVNNLREASVQAGWLDSPTEKKARDEKKNRAPVSSAAGNTLPTSRRPKLSLRAMTEAELLAIAESGTPITQAAEPSEYMTDNAMGGSDESH